MKIEKNTRSFVSVLFIFFSFHDGVQQRSITPFIFMQHFFLFFFFATLRFVPFQVETHNWWNLWNIHDLMYSNVDWPSSLAYSSTLNAYELGETNHRIHYLLFSFLFFFSPLFYFYLNMSFELSRIQNEMACNDWANKPNECFSFVTFRGEKKFRNGFTLKFWIRMFHMFRWFSDIHFVCRKRKEEISVSIQPT